MIIGGIKGKSSEAGFSDCLSCLDEKQVWNNDIKTEWLSGFTFVAFVKQKNWFHLHFDVAVVANPDT